MKRSKDLPCKKTISKDKKFTVQTLTEGDNIFTYEGLLTKIIEDLNNQKDEIKSIQRSLALFRQDIRGIVREESGALQK